MPTLCLPLFHHKERHSRVYSLSLEALESSSLAQDAFVQVSQSYSLCTMQHAFQYSAVPFTLAGSPVRCRSRAAAPLPCSSTYFGQLGPFRCPTPPQWPQVSILDGMVVGFVFMLHKHTHQNAQRKNVSRWSRLAKGLNCNGEK